MLEFSLNVKYTELLIRFSAHWCNKLNGCKHLHQVEQCVKMVVFSGTDRSLCFDSLSRFQLCGISSNIPAHPLSEEWAEAERFNKLPSPSASRPSLTLAEKDTFRRDAGSLAQALDAAHGELAGSSRPASPPAPLPPAPAAGNSGSYGL